MIDHTAYPHIIDNILSHPASWLPLRSTSRHFRARCEELLSAHLVAQKEGRASRLRSRVYPWLELRGLWPSCTARASVIDSVNRTTSFRLDSVARANPVIIRHNASRGANAAVVYCRTADLPLGRSEVFLPSRPTQGLPYAQDGIDSDYMPLTLSSNTTIVINVAVTGGIPIFTRATFISRDAGMTLTAIVILHAHQGVIYWTRLIIQLHLFVRAASYASGRITIVLESPGRTRPAELDTLRRSIETRIIELDKNEGTDGDIIRTIEDIEYIGLQEFKSTVPHLYELYTNPNVSCDSGDSCQALLVLDRCR